MISAESEIHNIESSMCRPRLQSKKGVRVNETSLVLDGTHRLQQPPIHNNNNSKKSTKTRLHTLSAHGVPCALQIAFLYIFSFISRNLVESLLEFCIICMYHTLFFSLSCHGSLLFFFLADQ